MIKINQVEDDLAKQYNKGDQASTETAAKLKMLQEQLNCREAELMRHKKIADDALDNALAQCKHLTLPLDKLLLQRTALRPKIMPEPEMQAADWRIVAVVGPAGVGKSSFVKNVVRTLGYPGANENDLPLTRQCVAVGFTAVINNAVMTCPMTMRAELVELAMVSHAGAGTRECAKYKLYNHKVLLLDCAGDASGGDDLTRAEIITADQLIVFMGECCRGERLHGEACVLAWRLRDIMNTSFVVSKTDLVQGTVPELRTTAAEELHHKLASLRARVVAASPRHLEPGVSSFLHVAENTNSEEWAEMLRSERWVEMLCYGMPEWVGVGNCCIALPCRGQGFEGTDAFAMPSLNLSCRNLQRRGYAEDRLKLMDNIGSTYARLTVATMLPTVQNAVHVSCFLLVSYN